MVNGKIIHWTFELFVMLKLNLFILCFSLLKLSSVCAQENVTTFGIQFKPILPINIFVDGPFEWTDSIYSGNIQSKTGYSFGMVVRHGLTKRLSLETGINFVRRNYDLKMHKQTDSVLLSDATDFGIVSYSIPLQGLVYIQLGEQLFMNASAGAELNAFASPTVSSGKNLYFNQLTRPKSRIQGSIIANLGFEYRTKEKGFFYLGLSYNLPMSRMARTQMTWLNKNASTHINNTNLSGQYLTLDLRYFFHEDPVKKKKKSSSDK